MAFEPDPFNAWLLERNLSENGIDNVMAVSGVSVPEPASVALLGVLALPLLRRRRRMA